VKKQLGCPFYKYGICTAVDNAEKAKTVVANGRCNDSTAWKTCKIYLSKKKKTVKNNSKTPSLEEYMVKKKETVDKKKISEKEKIMMKIELVEKLLKGEKPDKITFYL